MDAANVDLKAFTQNFYHRVCAGHLDAVLDTLEYLRHETNVWFEITTLLIPTHNDSDRGNRRGDPVDRRTPRARRAAALHRIPPGLQDARPTTDAARDTRPRPPNRSGQRLALRLYGQRARLRRRHDLLSWCGAAVVVRDWYILNRYELTDRGTCRSCGTAVPGVYDGPAGGWGARRQRVNLSGAR